MTPSFRKIFLFMRLNRALQLGAGAILALTLSACATMTPVHPNTSRVLPTVERNQVISSLKYWRASGEAVLSTPKQNENFGFRWKQSPQLQELSIYDPLGRTVARITVEASGAHLETITGEHRQARNLSTLLSMVLHVELPAAELPDWMLGLRGNTSTISNNASGLPNILRSGPWQVHYLQYTPVGGLTMPKLLQANGPDGIALRMAITQWQMGQAE
ncbi:MULTISPECIES: lipoprotein insertase outer membrane protein LolB [Acidithiobacillus]|jgi:outer membrane lipoprotein LolB|uniref:Outer-membrane lipoprotein LolB n=1 Tax=Acidithiobacillus thiooxidans ATCC 19377 TaxID=637390 RepID=A0A5P9XUW7_ACITH|nr:MULTISPECIES: lipoprotein insertase outer membrane protein LolB [Acidithiobacillus]MDA8175848.1 lipoprotein insertase outer membrane protein LolB [Acidithiobacillus sp.]QFX97449.1 outer membrane lipoprotein LolB [Acidithiobacillus thiooxidans ATCC 19377]